jgi:hypothetical protein
MAAAIAALAGTGVMLGFAAGIVVTIGAAVITAAIEDLE